MLGITHRKTVIKSLYLVVEFAHGFFRRWNSSKPRESKLNLQQLNGPTTTGYQYSSFLSFLGLADTYVTPITKTNYPYSFKKVESQAAQAPLINTCHNGDNMSQVQSTFLIGTMRLLRGAAEGGMWRRRAAEQVAGELNVRLKCNTTAMIGIVCTIHMPVEAPGVDIAALLSSPLSLVHTFPQLPVASLPAAIHDVSRIASTRTNQLDADLSTGCFARLVCWDQLGTSSQPQQCQAT
jgi:hypothetical protein